MIHQWVHQDAYDPDAKVDGVTFIDIGPDKPVLCSKPRFMIVLEVREDGYVAIPSGTRGGWGLAGLPEHRIDSFISVQDHLIREPGSRDFPQQGKHKPLRTKEARDRTPIDDLSVIKLDELFFGSFSAKVMLHGCLEEESLTRLLELVKARVFRHEEDVTGAATAVHATEPKIEPQDLPYSQHNHISWNLRGPAELENAFADAEIKAKAAAADLSALRIWQTIPTSVAADPPGPPEIEREQKAAQLYDSFVPQS